MKGTIVCLTDKKNIHLLFVGLILYISAIALSFISAMDKLLVVKSIIKWIEVFIIVSLIFIYVSKVKLFKNIYWILFISNFIAICYVLFKILLSDKSYLYFSIFPGYVYAFSFSLLLPFLNIRKNRIIWLLLIICLISTILSRARGAYIALIICVFYSLYINKKNLRKILLSTACLIFIVLIIPYFRETVFRNLNLFLFSIKVGSNTERITLISLAMDAIVYNPIIGVGSLNFPMFTFSKGIPKGIISTNFDTLGPHNTFLQIAAEEGLLGLAFFCLILFALFQLIKNKNILSGLEDRYIYGFHYFSIVLFFSLLFGYIVSPLRFYFAILLGLSAASCRVLSTNR